MAYGRSIACASSSCTTTTTTILLAVAFFVSVAAAAPQPVIFDTDYGSFIDDIFALGLLVNSNDLLDLKMVITTSEDPELSGKCVAKHLDLSGYPDIPVAIGSALPPYDERGSVCALPGLIGFALESECQNVTLPLISNGTQAMAEMIMESDHDDWWYIVVGGQTTLRDLLVLYPEAAAKIDTLIVMAGNWCADFEPYPNITAPTDETNIGCDPAAANDVLNSDLSPITNVYYVPVVMADVISGEDYVQIVQSDNPAAKATIDFYRAWSEAGRADPDLLINLEALAYDPETESTPMFDPCAIMLALELLSTDAENRVSLFEFEAVHFLEAGEGEAFPASPRSAFSLYTTITTTTTTGGELNLPDQCPSLTNYTFNKEETPEVEIPVQIGLGYVTATAKASFYAEMAARMAGNFNASSNSTHENPTALVVGAPTTTPESPLDDPSVSPSNAPVVAEPSMSASFGAPTGGVMVFAIVVALVSLLV